MERQLKTVENSFIFAYVPSESTVTCVVQNHLLECYILYSCSSLCSERDFLDTVRKNSAL